jgi:hypothetical protein
MALRMAGFDVYYCIHKNISLLLKIIVLRADQCEPKRLTRIDRLNWANYDLTDFFFGGGPNMSGLKSYSVMAPLTASLICKHRLAGTRSFFSH